MSTLRWQGSAQSVTDLWTLTLSGTVTSQTYTITVGNKTLQYTSTGGDTATTIFTAILALYNSTTSPVPPEFKELVATQVGATLVLTGTVTGVPHTVAFSTGGAATATATNTAAASGPNFWNVGANWSGGSAPANGDTTVFESGAISCKYGLSTSLTTVTVSVQPGYSGTIGLPDLNQDNSPYYEYRTASLTLVGGTLICNAPNVNLVRINFSSTLATVRVLNTGGGLNGQPAVLITGGAASSECDITKGFIGLAYFATETANFPTLKIGYVSQQTSDARVYVGSGCTVTTITKNGGTLDLYANCTTLSQDVTAGITTLYNAVAITTLNCNGGQVNVNTTGTIATVGIKNDGFLNCDADPRAKTVTNSILMTGPNCRISDAEKTINSGVLTITATSVNIANIYHGLTNGFVIT